MGHPTPQTRSSKSDTNLAKTNLAETNLAETSLIQPLSGQTSTEPCLQTPKQGNVGASSNAHPAPPLGTFGCRAIDQHFKKMVRHEAAVLKDTDMEELHQMRIGLRCLRTTLQTFGTVLDLPEPVRDVTLKPLAKRLGRVRDLDVLSATLRDRDRPALAKKEQKALDQILAKLARQRDRQFKQMQQFLHSARYASIKRAFKTWIKHPRFNGAAALLLPTALPDLLLPVLSQTLLHPGWLATPGPMEKPITRGELNHGEVCCQRINTWLEQDGTVLHELRKQIKQLRYQADFFIPYYDAAYGRQIKEFKTIQELLGTLQDHWVLSQTLTALCGSTWTKTLPTVMLHISQDRWTTWQQWEIIRQRYMTAEVRSHLRQLMLNPLPNIADNAA